MDMLEDKSFLPTSAVVFSKVLFNSRWKRKTWGRRGGDVELGGCSGLWQLNPSKLSVKSSYLWSWRLTLRANEGHKREDKKWIVCVCVGGRVSLRMSCRSLCTYIAQQTRWEGNKSLCRWSYKTFFWKQKTNKPCWIFFLILSPLTKLLKKSEII